MTYHHCDFFVLRSPLLPFSQLTAVHDRFVLDAERAESADAEAAYSACRQGMADYLIRLVDDAAINEALWIASPGLCGRLHDAAQSDHASRDEDMLATLYKYFVRMSSRCTPFGLFASCSMGKVGPEVALRVAGSAKPARGTRLDTEYIYRLVSAINGDRRLRGTLHYRANSGIYEAGDRLNYAEARVTGEKRGISYKLSAVDTADYLLATLRRAEQPARLAVLAEALAADDPELSGEECLEYLHDLVDNQLLVPEIMPAVTGGAPLREIVADLVGNPDAQSIVDVLQGVETTLAQMDGQGLGGDTAHYQAIAGELKALPAQVEEQHLFQADMYVRRDVVIDQRLIDAIASGVELLHSISTPLSADLLDDFKRRFQERYEGQEIPLCEALDDEIGIGFGGSAGNAASLEPLLNDINLQGTSDNRGGQTLSHRDLRLLDRIQRLEHKRGVTLELDAKLIDELKVKRPEPFPDAWSAFVTILAGNSGSDRNYPFLLKSATGPGAGNLLGRFCHLDPELEDAVRNCLQQEESVHPEHVYAEIAHMPEGRMGNILRRPVLRDHEIAYLCKSHAQGENRIAIQDIMVSVGGDRINLRSRRTGKTIVPRLASAHNFMRGDNLNMYRFLCLLQHQGVHHALMWDWGGLTALDFLPRVTHKRMVLAAACWKLHVEDITPLTDASGLRQFQLVRALRERLSLPRKLRIAEGDNDMLFDLDCPFSCAMFCKHLSSFKQGVTVHESLLDEYGCALEIDGQAHANEIVVPYVRTA